MVCDFAVVKSFVNTEETNSNTPSPDSRITAKAPIPGGVEIATMQLLLTKSVIQEKAKILDKSVSVDN